MMKYMSGINKFNELLIKTVISTIVILLPPNFCLSLFFNFIPINYCGFCNTCLFIYIVFWPVTQFILWISNMILKYFFKTKTADAQDAFSKLELSKFISQPWKKPNYNDDETRKTNWKF